MAGASAYVSKTGVEDLLSAIKRVTHRPALSGDMPGQAPAGGSRYSVIANTR